MNLEIWNNFINEVNPVYKTDVKDFIQCSDAIITHGKQKEVLDELDNYDVSITVFDLTGTSHKKYATN